MHKLIQVLIVAIVGVGGSSAQAVDYIYDELHRLTSVDYGNGKTITYSYDAAGNMLTVVKNGLIPQTITPGPAPSVKVGGTGTVSATVSSPLTVTFSVTPNNGVCSLAGAVVTGISQGTCTVYADQAGDATYAPAPQVSIMFSISPATPPSPPIINSITAGPGSATIQFSPPSNNGGGAILSYTASCSATGEVTRTATVPGSATSVTVTGLTPGVQYACSLTASNGSSSQASSATVTPKNRSDLTPILMLLLD